MSEAVREVPPTKADYISVECLVCKQGCEASGDFGRAIVHAWKDQHRHPGVAVGDDGTV